MANDSEQNHIDRRRFLRNAGLGMAAGSAILSAPAVIDSFTSRAWAAGGTALLDQRSHNSSVIEVAVRANAAVAFELSGGGGGGGASSQSNTTNTNVGGNGGAGTRLTGTIPAQSAPYTLYVAVGQGGDGGVNPAHGSQANTKGLSLYGSGGIGAGVLSGEPNKPGRGGGGGGATAISNSPNFDGSILVVAPGGGGGGGRGTHWDWSNPRLPDGGSLQSGTFAGGVLDGADGIMSNTGSGTQSGENGFKGTSDVGVGGRSAQQVWGGGVDNSAGWPGFNGGCRVQNASEGWGSSDYVNVRSTDGGGGGVGGAQGGTNGWDGGGGGGGGGGYRGGGGGGGAKGWNSNGAGDGGGGASGSAYTSGTNMATVSAGAARGTGGPPKQNGTVGQDGWVTLETTTG